MNPPCDVVWSVSPVPHGGLWWQWHGAVMVVGASDMVMPEFAGLCCMFIHCCNEMLPDCSVSVVRSSVDVP